MASFNQKDDLQQRVNVSGNTINLMNGTLQIQALSWAGSNGSSATNGVRWQHWHGSQPIPTDAVQAGYDVDDAELFVGQVFYEGNLLPAKAIPDSGCALFAYDGEEFQESSCQLLCGRNASWVQARNGIIPSNAIPGGHTASGEVLYIGRTRYCNSLTPGKVVPSERKLYIPFGCCEVATKRFEILVLK